MSIAAISSSLVTATRASAAPAPVDPAAAAKRSHREGGRRHELVDAMNQALGQSGPKSKAAEQAVFRFAHALMHDLRSIDVGGSREGPGRGVAWGRRDWSDLPQRIDALATAAGAAPAVEPPATQAPATVAPPPELPQQPNPVTTTSAAVHLMQVPSSRLLEAYVALREALGRQETPVAPTATGVRGELAAFLDRLSDTLAPDTRAALPAGSVLHVTA
jgi:hypothetical protein